MENYVLCAQKCFRGLSLKEALVAVKRCRDIRPNDGFLRFALICCLSFLAKIISCFDVVSQTLMNQILQATATLRESFGKVMKRYRYTSQEAGDAKIISQKKAGEEFIKPKLIIQK